jgi:hypothetical protein
MSRTYKDRPSRLKHGSYADDTIRVPYEAEWYGYALSEESNWKLIKATELKTGTRYYTVHLPTTKTKKSRSVDTEWHWMSTPNWWISCKMTRPQRRAGSVWEHTVTRTPIEEIDLLDTPSVSRKPKVYYW